MVMPNTVDLYNYKYPLEVHHKATGNLSISYRGSSIHTTDTYNYSQLVQQ